MKIIATHHPENLVFYRTVITLNTVNPKTFIWLSDYKSLWDMFDEVSPDIFICTTQDFTSSLISALQEKKTDLILFGDRYPPTIQPIKLCTEKPPTNNVPYTLVGPAANIAQYNSGVFSEKDKSDVLYLSNTATPPEILQFLKEISKSDFSLKVCGNPLPLPQYIGQVGVKETSNLIASSSCILDYNQNSLWDAGFHKRNCISNPHEIVTVENFIKDLSKIISTNSQNSNEAYIAAKNNTYYHIIRNVFSGIDKDIRTSAKEQCEKIISHHEQVIL